MIQAEVNDNGFSQLIQHDINVATTVTSDRMARRRALEAIKKRAGMSDEANVHSLFQSHLLALIVLLKDSIEKCRELSIQFLTIYFTKTNCPDEFLPQLIGVILERLANKDVMEPSEELRLELVKLIHVAISNSYTKSPELYVNDVLNMVTFSILDPYPNVKKESCNILETLCKKYSREAKMFGEKLSLVASPCLSHRHSTIRIAGMKAVTEVIIVDASGLDKMIPALKALLHDKSPAVREQVYKAAEKWLLQLPDRYSFGYKILPFLLCGIFDEVQEFRSNCKVALDIVGRSYEEDFEERLTEELEFSPAKGNWSIGTRHAVRDHVMKLVDNFVVDLNDWSQENRIKSVEGLISLIDIIGENITGYSHKILLALLKSSIDSDNNVFQRITELINQFGKHVEFNISLDLILPKIKAYLNDNVKNCTKCLSLVTHLTKGFLNKEPPVVCMKGYQILVQFLQQPDCIRNENIEILNEIAKIHAELAFGLNEMKKQYFPSEENEIPLDFELFMVLLQLSSCELLFRSKFSTSSLNEEAIRNIKDLTLKSWNSFLKFCERNSIEDLVELYFVQSLEKLKIEGFSEKWSKHGNTVYYFEELLHLLGSRVDHFLHSILTLLGEICQSNHDPETRQRGLVIVLGLVEYNKIDPRNCFIQLCITIIVPCLHWQGGPQFDTLRELALHLLYSIVSRFKVVSGDLPMSPEAISNITAIIQLVLQNLDERKMQSRRFCLNIIMELLTGTSYFLNIEQDLVNKAALEVLKRLDDAEDQVRLTCLDCILALISCSTLHREEGASSENIFLSEEVVEQYLRMLSIHMDDKSNANIQEKCYQCLEILSQKTQKVKPYLSEIRGSFRSQIWLEKLLR